jgi:hypothetical protein
MTKKVFFLRKKFWLFFLKCFLLLFVGSMILIQIPELRYDFGPKQPIEISGPEDLTPDSINRTTFASVAGTPNFDRAFIYQRYGLNYTYFIIEPYGISLVARTYEKVTDDWKNLNRFLGKIIPFNKQPFSYRIREIYWEKFQEEVPKEAFFLALYDAPKPSGWQIGALTFASLLWLVLFYVFFLYKRRRISFHDDEKHQASNTP